jgi:hypothetical protein
MAEIDAVRVALNTFPYEAQLDFLSNWIFDLRDKRRSFRRGRRKDLRVQTILTCALKEAKALLRMKVGERKLWQLLE